VPSGGIAKVPSFVSLFGGNKLHLAVLTIKSLEVCKRVGR
jgi:hypothetical protein